MRLVCALAMASMLSGCAGLAGASGGAIATEIIAVNTDTDDVLAAAKPVNEVLCVVKPWWPSSCEAEAAINAFCAHLPSNTLNLAVQLFAIVDAVEAAHKSGNSCHAQGSAQ